MPKLRGKKILAPEKEILAFPDHYVTLPGKIAYATLKSVAAVDADFDGVKTLKKGTVIKMDADGVVTAAGAADGNGIVFNTIKYSSKVLLYMNVAKRQFWEKNRFSVLVIKLGDVKTAPVLMYRL